MAGETIITVVGNLTADPELRYTQNGLAVANFTIASTPKVWDKQANAMKDGEALFMRCSVWREFAEHVSQSLLKGNRVIAQGVLKQRSFETQQGEKRTTIELQVESIGPDLRWATAQVTRAAGQGAGQGQRAAAPAQQGQQGGGFRAPGDEPWGQPAAQQGFQQPTGDPFGEGQVWGAPGTAYNDETPF